MNICEGFLRAAGQLVDPEKQQARARARTVPNRDCALFKTLPTRLDSAAGGGNGAIK